MDVETLERWESKVLSDEEVEAQKFIDVSGELKRFRGLFASHYLHLVYQLDPLRIKKLIEDQKLEQEALEIENEFNPRYENLVKEIREKQNVPEFPDGLPNPLTWVATVNNIQAQAREIIFDEMAPRIY